MAIFRPAQSTEGDGIIAVLKGGVLPTGPLVAEWIQLGVHKEAESFRRDRSKGSRTVTGEIR
jgi:hypothetical protein